jgi:hypothetical protein
MLLLATLSLPKDSLADGGRGESIVDGLGAGELINVLSPCNFTILVAYS